MRLAEGYSWAHEFQLAEPYTIAYQTYDTATNFFIRLTDDAGLHGFGCASPAEEVTGESFETCSAALAKWCAQSAGGDLKTLRSTLPTHAPAAAAAVDMALVDLEARRRDEPVYRTLGARSSALPTSITIGISGLEETLDRATAYRRQGFEAFKIKGGRDVALDVERILALRRDLGADVDLRFDANQGYSEQDALQFAQATLPARLSVIEQPTKRDDVAALQSVRASLSTTSGPRPALLADEAALGAGETEALTREGAVDGVVIKLMKCGGLGAAADIDALAATHGLRCMVSCMDEAALAIAAGLHFALAARRCAWIDLDGHLDLIDDPTAGAVRLDAGRLRPADAPGFGVAPQPR